MDIQILARNMHIHKHASLLHHDILMYQHYICTFDINTLVKKSDGLHFQEVVEVSHANLFLILQRSNDKSNDM